MSTTWDQVTGVTPIPARPPRRHRSMLGALGEEAITFGLTFVALIAAITSIQRADWVPEMPNLGTVAAMSLLGGWLLARTRINGWLLHLVGIPLGIAYATYEVAGALRLATGTPDTIEARLRVLWERNADWVRALREGAFSTDPIPFVLMVVVATWALAYLAAWAVARWRNPWLALMPGAIALLTNISYLPGQPAAELVVFLFAAILLFARLHMLRAVEDLDGEAGELPLLLSLEVLNLATWVGVALIIAAWLIPTANHWGPVAAIWQQALSPLTRRVERVGDLFIGVSSKRSVGIHAFESVLPLQGSVVLGSRPLMTVSAAEEAYLRGAVYDQYTSNGWRVGPTTERTFQSPTIDAANAGTPQLRTQQREPVQASVHVQESFARRRVFSIGEPIAADEPSRIVAGGAPEDVVALAPVTELGPGAEYDSVGSVSIASVDRLMAANADYPAWVRDRYLQLPATLPSEVRLLARQVAGDEKNPYRVAARMEDYLRRSYLYALDIGQRPPQQDSVQYFLFDRRQGYSDYFASSMAVMLRSVGVPSRVAVGFALADEDRDPVTQDFVVSDQQAWVWPQVYFPSYGWVDFNPTPTRATVARLGEPAPTATPGSEVPADGAGADDPNLDLDVPVEDAAPGVAAASESAFDRFVRRTMTGLVMLAAVAAVAGGVGWVAWDTPFRRFDPATRRWAKLQTLAAWAGVRLRTDRTPMEEATQLGAAIRRPPIDLRPLARAYAAERYGRGSSAAESAETTREMEIIYTTARERLVRRALSRFFSIRG